MTAPCVRNLNGTLNISKKFSKFAIEISIV